MNDKVADLAARRAQGPKDGRKDRRKAKARSCPICGKPASPADRPFCSARCRKIDLDRWFGEAYRVPVEEEPEGARQDEDET
jgi:endogenous inhibitor of DNA gyrase (YacG/DUF329 family)